MPRQETSQSYHPLLPGPTAASAPEYNDITSDHLPFLVSIPGTDGEPIKIVSWNVMQADAVNGFAPLDKANGVCTQGQEQEQSHKMDPHLLKFKESMKPK